MKPKIYKKYKVFHKGKLVEVMTATNKSNAIWGVWSVNDHWKKKDLTAELHYGNG
jgi:hypothetical protein